MNDQQIYALMAKTPKIRAVQIADALDVELDDVKEKLRFLVSMGDVIESDGFSPNGHPAKVYNPSEKFKRSFDTVAAGQSAATEAPAVAPPAPAAEAEPAKDEPGRAARALAYIELHGSATDAQLRALMGLPDDVWPSTYLSKDAQAGRVVKMGHEWKPGNGKPLRQLKRQPAFGGPLSLPGASPFDVAPPPAPKAKRQAVKPAPTKAPAPAAPAPTQTAPPFRCGIWLDDVIELRRGGATVDQLARDEALVLRDFLNRVLPAEESA